MEFMNTNAEPVLAPPGAGLPKIELAVARLIVAWNRLGSDRTRVNAKFDAERQEIMRLVHRRSPEEAARRVLIERPRGLEDSSRYWSVWMTLDHLRIVNESIARIIQSLASGSAPEGKASTANVKPSQEVDATTVEKFQTSCDTLLATVAAVSNLRTRVRFAHPWFGPLDAAGWHSLSAGHMSLHRLQMERIIEGLKYKGSAGAG
jgi:hypothetical protein